MMHPNTGVVGCADIAMLSSLLNKSDSLEGGKKKKKTKETQACSMVTTNAAG